MDNNINKALWIGIGILFFVAVVSIGLTLLNQSTEIAQNQSRELSDIQQKLADSKFSGYDNQSVSGSQVLSAIKNFRENKDIVSIQVKTKKSTNVYLNSATFSGTSVTLGSAKTDADIETSIKNARDEKNGAYINPVANFDAQIRKDSNGVISGIVFTQ